MDSLRKLFITGITGSVGSWVARQALEDGTALVALVREDGTHHITDRIRNALAIAGREEPMDRIEALAGDITCDLDRQRLPEACRGVDAVIHCAASMNFADEYASQNYAVNVEGTRRMLELAEALNVPFVYVSTAYIAGEHGGVVREEPLPEPTAFNNSYEKTKYLAEQAVFAWNRRTGLDAWIFRPSIILGDSQTGRIVNFDAMYNILRFLDMVSGRLDGQTLRVGADPDATKNCIPVDYLARSVWHVFRNADPGIYHITHPAPLRLSELEIILKQLFDIENARFVAPEQFEGTRLSKPELLFRRSASVYFPYLLKEPVFNRARSDAVLRQILPCPALDVSYFDRILNYARQSQWGQDHGQAYRPEKDQLIVKTYYDTFLQEKIGQQLLPDLKRLNSQFNIYISDVRDSCRTLTIRQGVLERISNNGLAYECTFSVNFDTFRKITAGTLAPQDAFFNRDVDIEGDIETGLKLATVLAVFFKKYPYLPDSRHE